MARPKGGNKKPEKEEHDDRHRAVIEAIRAKRQECLEALEKSDLLAPVKFSQEISRISCPSRPSLPLAQASKLAAHCAIALHLRAGLKAAEDAKLQHAVIWLISKAVTWAWEGFNTHKSGLCAKLWVALAFLVEDKTYRQTFLTYVHPHAETLGDTKDDEIEEARKQPWSKSQAGGESTALGMGKGMKQALQAARSRIEGSKPLKSGMSLGVQYIAILHRLFAYHTIDFLYPPLSKAEENGQLHHAVVGWNWVENQLTGAVQAHNNLALAPDAALLEAQMNKEPGRFRLLANKLGAERLIALDLPVEEDAAHDEALPACSAGIRSRFFERREADVASNKGRLPAAKEREANEKAKLVLEYWSTLAEPTSSDSVVEMLEVPLPLLRAQLEQQMLVAAQYKGDEAVEHIALQAAVLEDCVSSGMAYARLSCNGQASLPSFSSEFAHALAQLDAKEKASEEEGACPTDDTEQSLYAQVIEGKGILWEGELPSSLSVLTPTELKQALDEQRERCRKAGGATDTEGPRRMNALFSASSLSEEQDDGEVVGRMASLWIGGHLESLLDGQEAAIYTGMRKTPVQALRSGSFGMGAVSPLYDAFNMEFLAQLVAGEKYQSEGGQPLLKRVFRPTLADLRAVTLGPGGTGQDRKHFADRETCISKYEPFLDLDDVGPNVDDNSQQLAQLCRGRLVLAMQSWLWRGQAWLHAPSWASKPEAPLSLPIQDAALRGLRESLHMNDEDLLHTCNYLIVSMGPEGKDPKDGSFLGSMIDEPLHSRYRFTPAEEGPGSASGRHGLTYAPTSLEENISLGAASTTDVAADKPKQDADASAASGPAASEGHGHENGSHHGAESSLNPEWLGNGPSPLEFPEPHAYFARSPDMKEEMIDEILDILEILRLSNLLSVDIVRAVAMLIAVGLKGENDQFPGANLLQVTWEHMTLLPQDCLSLLRDSLLNCLGQRWRWTYPVREMADQALYPQGCFQLKQDKSGFHIVEVPAKQELIIEAAMRPPPPCPRCHPGAEHARAHEELPGPPANPPKQHRSRGKSESQPQDNGMQPSGKATAGSGIGTASSAPPDLAQELRDASNHPGKLSKFIVEALYGAGNKASVMLPYVMHVPRPEACTVYKKQMLCAAACAKLVRVEMASKDKLSRSLQKAVATLPFILNARQTVAAFADKFTNPQPSEQLPVDMRLLAAVFEDVHRKAAGIWASAIEEVKRQASIDEAHSSAVMAMMDIDRALLRHTIFVTRDGTEDNGFQLRRNLKQWESHTWDIRHRLGRLESRAAPGTDRIPSPSRLRDILQKMNRSSVHELTSIVRGCIQDLREAMAAGVLALTSVDHRLAALRTAVISIERRMEQELKLYCGDVLQTSLVTVLTEKLHKEAQSEMEEKRRKAEEVLLSGEAESEKLRLEASAKRAAKKERQLRQKAEALRVAEEKAAAEAAAAEPPGGASGPASHAQDAEADAAAHEAKAEGLELPGPEGSNGTGPHSALHSHSLGGDAYSEDEFAEPYEDEEQEHSSRVTSVPQGSEQQEASAAGAQKKKKNRGGRKRAAAVRAGSEEQQQQQQQQHSSAAFLTAWPSEAQDDGSEWQEAKPKRSHQRKDQQLQLEEGPSTPQKPQQGANGQAERGGSHVRDPILATISRQKPLPSSRECAQCGNNAHKVMDCPQLQSMSRPDKADCCVALMDGDHARVERIRTEPRMSCHACDGTHELHYCPWLRGMPEAMLDHLLSTYKRLKIHEKDRILRHWVEIRRDIQRRLPPDPLLTSTSGAPSYISPSKALQPHSLQQGMQRQEQPQRKGRYDPQEAAHSETAYLSAEEDAAFEQTPFPSPARPQPRSKARPAPGGAPGADARSEPYAASGEQWDEESSGAEETSYHSINYVGGMEPAVGTPVEPGVARADQDMHSLMTMLCPQPPGPKGWSKVVAEGEPADLSVGPTPGEAQRRAAAAAQAKQEEDDMQAAIQASLTQTRPAPAQLTRLAQQMGPPQQQQPQTLTGPGAGMPGLQNQIGEYNCFLNVVVQCLWHCRDFKRQFSSLAQENPDIVQSNDVVAGLADLFSKFDAQERLSEEQQESAQRQIVAPTKLRDALHALDPHRFSTGEMSDAAEVLGAIYEQLAELPKIGKLATQVFELPVREAVHCQNCGKDTHQSSFGQSFYCVSATALRMQAMLAQADNEGDMPPLGELLLGIDAQDQKTCDTDEGGCGRLNHIQRFLEGVLPPVFTLQLAWESHAESTEAITEVLDAVQEEVDIGEIYKALGSKEYRLHSMVCYYGEHYHAFVHTEGRWVAFDDATLNQVGGWEDVVKKCILGKIQPSLLFYEAALGG